MRETKELLEKYSETMSEWKQLFHGMAGLSEATERAIAGKVTNSPADQVVVGFIEDAVAGAMTFLTAADGPGVAPQPGRGGIFSPLWQHEKKILAVVRMIAEGTVVFIIQSAEASLLENQEQEHQMLRIRQQGLGEIAWPWMWEPRFWTSID